MNTYWILSVKFQQCDVHINPGSEYYQKDFKNSTHSWCFQINGLSSKDCIKFVKSVPNGKDWLAIYPTFSEKSAKSRSNSIYFCGCNWVNNTSTSSASKQKIRHAMSKEDEMPMELVCDVLNFAAELKYYCVSTRQFRLPCTCGNSGEHSMNEFLHQVWTLRKFKDSSNLSLPSISIDL